MKLDQMLEKKIVSLIVEMDVRMLDVLLPENGVYEDTFKEVWLGKLITFFKMCKVMGDSVLTVSQQQCVGGHWCKCNQKMWLFKSESTGKGFAIYFVMVGDEIKRIERCYGHYIDDLKETYSNETFDIEAFYVYSHEKIGFIDTYELKKLRKEVKLFMAELMNPKRLSLGTIGLKRLVPQYNQLYFEVKDVPCLFEYRIEMLQIYEDLFALRNMFAQQKSFQLVINKCRELIQCTDTKSKAKFLKWFVRNEHKVNKYLVYYFDLQVEAYKMVYLYRVNLVDHRLTIRHPDIKMDIEACNLLQTYIKLFYDYMQNVHVKSISYDSNDNSEAKPNNYFKNNIEDMITPCEVWINGVTSKIKV